MSGYLLPLVSFLALHSSMALENFVNPRWESFREAELKCADYLFITNATLHRYHSSGYPNEPSVWKLIYCIFVDLNAWDQDRQQVKDHVFSRFFIPSAIDCEYKKHTEECLLQNVVPLNTTDTFRRAYQTFQCYYRNYCGISEDAKWIPYHFSELVRANIDCMRIRNYSSESLLDLCQGGIASSSDHDSLADCFFVRLNFYNQGTGMDLEKLYVQYGSKSLLHEHTQSCLTEATQQYCGRLERIGRIGLNCLIKYLPATHTVGTAAREVLGNPPECCISSSPPPKTQPCYNDLSAWDEGTGFNMNKNLNSIQGAHFSQHEASVNAARKGAAERLTRIGAGVGTSSCGSTICYSGSGFSDNSDAETVGQGIVGFNAGSAGSSSSSSKYQASSHQESAAGVVPVYPVLGSSKSSYASSAQRHSASSVTAAQPVNYISSAEGVKTRSNFGATSGTTVVQPIVASGYPIGQEASQRSQYASASRNTNAGLYTVPVESNNAYRTRSSYASSSERQESAVAQPVYTSSGDLTSKYVAASATRQENQQRYVPSNTYVVYRQPVPVPIYTPVSSSGFDASARYSTSEGSNYRVPVVFPVRSSSNQYSAADNQQTYIAHGGQPVYGISSDHSSLSNQHRSNSQYVRPAYQPVYSNHLAASQQSHESHTRDSDSRAAVGLVVAPVVTSSANRHENEERHEEYSRKGSTYIPITVNPGSAAQLQYTRPAYQPVYTNHVAASEQSKESHSRASDSGSTVGVVVAPAITSSANRVENEERHEQYSRKGTSYVPVAVNSGSTASKYSAQNEHRSLSGTSYAPLVAATSSESHNQRHNSASQYSAAQQHASNAGSYYPVGTTGSHGSRYSASESQNAYSQQRAGGYSPYPITNDALGQRFGAVGLELNSNNDLGGLMSESERLARLQAKNAYNGAVSGSSAVDMENRFSGANDDVSEGVGAGAGSGFKRTKSWSSSSKWAAGQKFGDDGKIKSYSSLSTAESEQHNINGQKTGYKAATTTLEDDGKVSTYSLHTP